MARTQVTGAQIGPLDLTTEVTGALPTANGGTGQSSLSALTLPGPTITGYTESLVAIGTVTSSFTLVITSGTVLTATLTASTACTFTMPSAAGSKSFVLILKQAASTGNGTAVFTGVKWPFGIAPAMTAGVNCVDLYSFISDGTSWYGTAVQNFS